MSSRQSSGSRPAPVRERDGVPIARPDWREADQYRHLLDLDRAGWAWEWLRRNPDYRRECADNPEAERNEEGWESITILHSPSLSRAGKWGLCFLGGAGS